MSIDVALLPERELAPGQLLYRIHRAGYGLWYFSADGTGRFDPTSSSGRGACYLAEEPLGAWVETFRTVMTVAEDDVRSRVLSVVEVDKPLILGIFPSDEPFKLARPRRSRQVRNTKSRTHWRTRCRSASTGLDGACDTTWRKFSWAWLCLVQLVAGRLRHGHLLKRVLSLIR